MKPQSITNITLRSKPTHTHDEIVLGKQFLSLGIKFPTHTTNHHIEAVYKYNKQNTCVQKRAAYVLSLCKDIDA